MVVEDFFDESTEQSQVKSEIVAKYFWAWAKVILPSVKKWRRSQIAYIDLFAGPGRYRDGSISTPLKVLEEAISDSDLSQTLVAIFNDLDQNNVQALQEAIAGLDGIQKLKYQPVVLNKEVGQEIVKLFEKMAGIPTLFFVDPWYFSIVPLAWIRPKS
ncbi:MAG TPA: three-Cys-motif partner protein TcmP [Acidobacteriota bacterium]|nr:three-Cys-motif partner protein TcmP [Acidobacteriota bacterium]